MEHAKSDEPVSKGRGAFGKMSRRSLAVSLNIRAKVQQRNLIDQAAARLGRSRSEFMLEAACQRAEDVLLDQAFFTVEASTFTQLQKLLVRPLPPTDRLRRLIKAKAPWEK